MNFIEKIKNIKQLLLSKFANIFNFILSAFQIVFKRSAKYFYLTQFYTWVLLLVFGTSLLTLISLTVQPIVVQAMTANTFVADDVMIVSNQFTNQQFRDHIGAGYAFYNGSLGQAVSLIKFNNPNLPAGAIVTGASINLKQYSHSILGGPNPSVYASRIDGNWNPSTVT